MLDFRRKSFWIFHIPCLFCAALLVTPAGAMAQSGPSSPFAAPRLDQWKVIGMGGGGAQFNPTISPANSRTVFENTDMTGAFVSHDGGESWRLFNIRGVVRFFVCDPHNQDVVYAQTSGLFRSEDGGRTWRLIYPDPANLKMIASVGDEGDTDILTKDGSSERFTALAVDPSDSRTLYGSVISRGGEAAFQVSTDFGKTWQKDPEPSARALKIYVDPASPQNGRTIYVIGEDSVHVRSGGKWSVFAAPEGVRRFNGVSGGFPAGGGKLVIYTVSGRYWRGGTGGAPGIYKSSDGGATWQRIEGGLLSMQMAGAPSPEWRAVSTSLEHPEVVYASYKNLRVGPAPAQSFMGVAKSIDGGMTWTLPWKDTGQTPGPGMHDAWINDRFGPDWGENPFDIAVDDHNPDLVYATDFGRTLRTTDGGKNWYGIYSKRLPGGGWSTTGLDLTTCYFVHFDPFDPQHLFISYTDISLMESHDGGTSWESATRHGFPREWENTTYDLVFDPQVKGRMWAVTSADHDLPRTKMWRHGRSVEHYRGGVVTSADGGKTWTVSDTGIGEAATTFIVLDPASPAGNRTLYVCAFGKGVYKSTDNGKTWTLKNTGIEGAQPFAYEMTRASDGTLYLVVARRATDARLGTPNDGALYRSTDAAEHWQRITLPEGCNGPTSLLVDAQDKNRLALGAWGRVDGPESDVDGGIYLSTDAGRTWKHVLTQSQHIHELTVDPRNDAYYACGFEWSCFRSPDRGETWKRIRGFNFKWGRRVIPDPQNPAMVYISTFGASVWYGPAEGDPKAVEDIVTPEAAYH
jgi:photosystem II stability/assembly factor-like uncharacterized protein